MYESDTKMKKSKESGKEDKHDASKCQKRSFKAKSTTGER